jgi:RsiW-degrading membrane proteinase PrsW (M82 family)
MRSSPSLLGLFLAAGLVISPFIFVYFLAIRWADRYEKEPLWALALCFSWGAVGATLGGGISTVVAEELTTPAILQATGNPAAVEATAVTVYAPIFEESFKGIGVLAVFLFGYLLSRELDGPLDGVVYGGVIGLGFTLTEDALYVAGTAAEEGAQGFVVMVLLRTVFGGLGHAMYTSMTGFGWGKVVTARSTLAKLFWPCFGFGTAMVLHAAHNLLPTLYGGVGGLLSIVMTWGFFLGWFVLIGVLIAGERRMVLSELAPEVGVLVRDAAELRLLGSVFARSFAETGMLFSKGFAAARASKHRSAQLIELAIVKARIGRGDRSPRILAEEQKLRAELDRLAIAAGRR